MRYEMIREILNKCTNNQMRDVFVEEVETDDPKAWLENYLAGKNPQIEETKCKDGSIIYNVMIANLMQKFTFSPDE